MPYRSLRPVAVGLLVLFAATHTSAQDAFSLRSEYERLGVKVRNQGDRGSCVLFGIIGCLDFDSAKAGGPTQLSEQFAGWANSKITHSLTGNSHSFDPTDVIAGLKKSGICSEELLPYKSNAATFPSKAALEDARTRENITLTWIHQWSEKTSGFSDAEIGTICKTIAAGHPVVCNLRWPKGGVWSRFQKTFTIENRDFQMVGGGHSVVLVGYEKGAQWEGGGRMQFRNSWGERWGEGGYAWFSFGFLKKSGDEAFSVVGLF